MNRNLLLAIILAGALAYAMRDAIERSIIQPLLYFFWFVKLYYEALPQIFLWIVLIAAVVLMEAVSLVTSPNYQGKNKVARKPLSGPVELLAEWMVRAPHGLYFKWLIAQRLGKLSRGLLSFHARQEPQSYWAPLAGPGWNPPGEVSAYLESGLKGSFADYPRSRWPFARQDPTPLDIDPVLAIDYIESQVEKT